MRRERLKAPHRRILEIKTQEQRDIRKEVFQNKQAGKPSASTGCGGCRRKMG
jgi:hypothetical protein